MYAKIAKWISWFLIIVSVAILVAGAAMGFAEKDGLAVDVLLRWGYGLLIAAVALVVVLGLVLGVMNNPKSLIPMASGILIVGVLVAIAYFTASGSPLVGYLGEQPDHGTLKLTDTLLNVTYVLGAGAIVSIIIGEIVSSVRK